MSSNLQLIDRASEELADKRREVIAEISAQEAKASMRMLLIVLLMGLTAGGAIALWRLFR